MTQIQVEYIVERFENSGIEISFDQAKMILELQYSFGLVGIYGDLSGAIITLILSEKMEKLRQEFTRPKGI